MKYEMKSEISNEYHYAHNVEARDSNIEIINVIDHTPPSSVPRHPFFLPSHERKTLNNAQVIDMTASPIAVPRNRQVSLRVDDRVSFDQEEEEEEEDIDEEDSGEAMDYFQSTGSASNTHHHRSFDPFPQFPFFRSVQELSCTGASDIDYRSIFSGHNRKRKTYADRRRLRLKESQARKSKGDSNTSSSSLDQYGGFQKASSKAKTKATGGKRKYVRRKPSSSGSSASRRKRNFS